MRGIIVMAVCCAALGVVFAEVAWPSDFAAQVAANHPGPSGTQIATSAATEVDARTAASLAAAASLALVEGRSTSGDASEACVIDARTPSGLLLIFR